MSQPSQAELRAGREREARAEEQAGHWKVASDYWRWLDNYVAAAMASEKAEDWYSASFLWERAGQHQKAALAFEKDGNWRDAATSWTKVGDHQRAAAAQLKDTAQATEAKAARIWEELGEWQHAAEAWEKAGVPDLATQSREMLRRVEDLKKAGIPNMDTPARLVPVDTLVFAGGPTGVFSKCRVCGRSLTDPSSKASGIGPECVAKVA
jgi:tetratricopeptide (TPR) repeat protein